MKRFVILSLVLLSSLLMSCAKEYATRGAISPDETWMCELETNSNRFTRGSDEWFKIGDAHLYPLKGLGRVVRKINLSMVRILKLNGNFNVHIVNVFENDCIRIEGPKSAINSVTVGLNRGVLSIGQIKKAPANMAQVYIHINVHALNELIQLGNGRIEGIINTNKLNILSAGNGHIYLKGQICLRRIINLGFGNVNVMGVHTPLLDIISKGTGNTKVIGNVGIRRIEQGGSNHISIIGANSSNLNIYAAGKGKLSICGIVNLREVIALGYAKVFVKEVRSPCLNVKVQQHARVGLAGKVDLAHLYAFNFSCLSARQLCVNTAYVNADSYAHINVASNHKTFAQARNHSSIYFFGSQNALTGFVNDDATIIPMLRYSNCCLRVPKWIPPQCKQMLPGEG